MYAVSDARENDAKLGCSLHDFGFIPLFPHETDIWTNRPRMCRTQSLQFWFLDIAQVPQHSNLPHYHIHMHVLHVEDFEIRPSWTLQTANLIENRHALFVSIRSDTQKNIDNIFHRKFFSLSSKNQSPAFSFTRFFSLSIMSSIYYKVIGYLNVKSFWSNV